MEFFMGQTIKAVLLSALVFPGAGHLAVKKPVRGLVLLGISLFCAYLILSTVFSISKELGGKIESGAIPYDPEQLTQLVTEKVSIGDYQYVSYAVIVFMMCWIFGVIDSFRWGRKLDKGSVSEKSF